MNSQPFELGTYYCENPHHDLLHHVLGEHVGYHQWPRFHSGTEAAPGIALEFGVGSGASLNCMARYLPVVGFDSFRGLPEDWRPGFDEGAFAYDFDEVRANTPDHCMLVPGMFQDTLPAWFADAEVLKPVKLIHIDCDLYTSTRTVLDNVGVIVLRDKPFVIFDEWHGYPGCEQFEQRAWREFAERTGIQWSVIGHGHEAWGIKVK